MNTDNLEDYWPKAMAHLGEPYDGGMSDHVVIAEINYAPQNGFNGLRLVRTALIPLDMVDEILSAPGGIGHEVRSWGPHPCVDEGRCYDTTFWIDGRKGIDERFQTIINSWTSNDRDVLLPDNVLLMTYGLVPRHLGDGTVIWDDLQGPVYDVLRVKSLVDHANKNEKTFGSITIRRDYLEDYCHLKCCAAVAVYYEERFSSDDETIERMLNGQRGAQFELPGRLLVMSILNDEYHVDAPQMSRAWGVRSILIPLGRPISDAKDPELIWPSDTEPMTYQRAAATWVYGYVRDEVLKEYEEHPEFRVHPESGGVSYGSWWAITRTHRIGRNHIQIELKKLYEGCPPHVIAHWHRFAVPEGVAEHDRTTHGNRNIAARAKEVVEAFLILTKAMERLSDRLGVGQTQEEIGVLAAEDIAYRGWWSPEVVHPLYAVVPLSASRAQFLERAVSLFKLLELLKPGPIRAMARQLGIPKEKTKDLQSLKLLASICQLATIAKAEGYSLFGDSDAAVALWDPKKELPELQSLFALSVLRISQAHTPCTEREAKIATAAGRLGVDVAATASGWGYAIDALYDRLSADLSVVARLIGDIE